MKFFTIDGNRYKAVKKTSSCKGCWFKKMTCERYGKELPNCDKVIFKKVKR